MTRRKLSDNDKFWLENGIDIEKRRITLEGEVDEFNVSTIIRGLRKMIDINNDDIHISIMSYGGDVYAGLALYDFIRSCDNVDIYTHAMGYVMSMGLILFLAGDERTAFPNTTFMAHEVSQEGLEGKLSDIKINAEELKRINNVLVEILRERTKRSKNWWTKEIEHKDYYFNYKKAKTLGIITEE